MHAYYNIKLTRYNKILYGNQEFYNNINNKTYYIYVINDDEKEIIMNELFEKYITIDSKNKYIAIDFEFNKISKTTRDVALMQINLEEDSNIGLIFLLNPEKLVFGKETLLRLLTDKSSIKILHGSESLDMPYLYNTLLENDDNILSFNKNFFDTKYICEYILNKLIVNGKAANTDKYTIKLKCSIYDLLIYYKIISLSKLQELENIEEEMEKLFIHSKNIDIYNLDSYILDYSMYDVLFLVQLMKIFYNNKSISLFLIKDIFNYININKRSNMTIFNKIESIVNKINNYFIIYDNKYIILNTMWNKNYEYILNIKYIKYIHLINYFKSFFKIITKYLLYSELNKHYRIYSKVNIIYNFEYYNILDDLVDYKYIRVHINKIINSRINKIINLRINKNKKNE